MKDLLVLQDLKAASSKKAKNIKKPSKVDFASILFENSKNTKNLFVLQNAVKAKNSVINKELKDLNSSKLNIALTKTSSSDILSKLLNNEEIIKHSLKKDLKSLENKQINDVDFGKELLDDLNFVQVLEFLEILKQDKKEAKLNDFFRQNIKTDVKLEKFNEIKNVHELIKLAKEQDLGLKELTFEKILNNEYNEDIFKKPFFKLYESNFFAHAKLENEIKQDLKSLSNQQIQKINTKEQKTSENEVKNVEKTLKNGLLNELLKENPKEHNSLKNNSKDGLKDLVKENTIIKESIQNTQVKNTEKLPTEKENMFEKTLLDSDTQNNETSNEKTQKIEKPIFSEFKHKIEQNKEPLKPVFDNFARDFKEELERFKAPIHKVKISLNPKELGEVNVTMIARGSNLHINFNSANANTLNLFIANQQEFKNSLVNMGFTGLAMNFGDKKEGSQQEQKSRKKQEEIEELESIAENEINAVLYRYF